MSGYRSGVLLLSLAVLLAGCGSIADDTTDREPYGVDSADDAEELLPGLTDEGMTSSSTLWLAHVDGLEDTAFERTDRTHRTDGDGAVVSNTTTRTVVAPGGEPALRVTEHVDDSTESAFWYGENETVARHVDDDGSATVNTHDDLSLEDPVLHVDPLALYDATDTVTVDDAGESTRYRLEGSGTIDQYENATFEVVLDDDGVVRAFTFTGETTHEGVPVTVEYHTTFTAVGEAIDLEKPDWVTEGDEP